MVLDLTNDGVRLIFDPKYQRLKVGHLHSPWARLCKGRILSHLEQYVCMCVGGEGGDLRVSNSVCEVINAQSFCITVTMYHCGNEDPSIIGSTSSI